VGWNAVGFAINVNGFCRRAQKRRHRRLRSAFPHLVSILHSAFTRISLSNASWRKPPYLHSQHKKYTKYQQLCQPNNAHVTAATRNDRRRFQGYRSGSLHANRLPAVAGRGGWEGGLRNVGLRRQKGGVCALWKKRYLRHLGWHLIVDSKGSFCEGRRLIVC
jgi:hypothetical protein